MGWLNLFTTLGLFLQDTVGWVSIIILFLFFFLIKCASKCQIPFRNASQSLMTNCLVNTKYFAITMSDDENSELIVYHRSGAITRKTDFNSALYLAVACAAV